MKNNIYLCAIANVQSGICKEDCKFCTQSNKYKTNIKRYQQLDIDTIFQNAKLAKSHLASGFCLVTSGARLDDKKVQFISKIAQKIKKHIPQLNLIACNGLATKEQLKELKKYGISSYNHNLECSKEFYPNICTTHTWQERYNTCENILEAGLDLCTGGIFGLGENKEDRLSLLNSIKTLKPKSIALNFFHPNNALPLNQDIINKKEAFWVIKTTKQLMPNSMIMVAGGREITFKQNQYDIFKYGANAIVIGDYLTTKGNNAQEDIINLTKLGYNIATKC